MDPQEIAAVVSAFTITQRQMLLILEALLNDNKRITHISTDTRHWIRHLTYFRMIHAPDLVCRESTRTDRCCFAIICHLLRTRVRLESTKHVDVEEMVTLFLYVLTHNVKNQQNCLEALNDTYIKVNMSAADSPRYYTRKGEVATNVLSVCDTKRDFVFILAGWKGSTADSRILRDALSRPNGYYYLCDACYPNAEGFLGSYKGQRYHLPEWCGVGNAPKTPKEFFNMKHYGAQNVIERVFSLLKGRWTILFGKSYYLIHVQCWTIMASCLLHNLINREMSYDKELDNEDDGDSTHLTTSGDNITDIEASNEWTQWHDVLALSMFNE
ncbi:retrotransposon protein [Cucumis melo var. makuwa]|uniref:Retrotransposon protein n=1 Tax=Cucumis melo var. makuwa TaxID=1194695 RepID=A0A5D3BGQ4_CUCMM|nr:retrotransposon protein [Cucumis melo var. makuwa]TYJ97655.1 retrotransposon protein [Cucumis melo var. makuwa]